MPNFEIPGVGTLVYHEAGSGPDVVFLHSALMDSRQWDREVREFADRYRVIAVDLPGFGQSSDPALPVDPADSLSLLMDHLGIARAHLVGSSLGGSIVIHAAIRNPQRVRSLFVAGTGMFGFVPNSVADEPPIYREYEAAWEAHDLEAVINIGAVIWLDGLSSSPAPMTETARQTFLSAYRDRLLNHPWSNPPFLPQNDMEGVLRLEPPAMVVIGENDTDYCLALADWLQQSVAAVTVHHMPGSAHFPNLSRPEEFHGLLSDWLRVHSG